jgi:hypothetical protein
VRAIVREHRPAQRQARQAKGKRENRYVIKVMKINREENVETISWKIFNQPIILPAICNLSHDNDNGINDSLTANYHVPICCYNSNYHAIKQIE